LSIHLHPTAPLAPRVLLPGDPGRALALAQVLLAEPKMFNHHRGLWGYTGMAADGAPLTIQATGMGGPSAAIVVRELADLGATHVVRIGTCRSLRADLALGRLVVATEAIAADGTSRALGAGERVAPDADLLAALRDGVGDVGGADGNGEGADGAALGPVVSHDLYYGDEDGTPPADALAVDLETAAILQAALRRGVRAASVLVVTDALVGGDRTRIAPEAIEAAGAAVGRAGAAALLAVAPGAPATERRLRLV
jgi:uridine phosphorylase